MLKPAVPVVLITGPIGVGKTSVADAIADRLRAAGLPYAMVDLDWIVECYPAPPDDPFQTALAMSNLAALWRNFRDAGARYLVLTRVVERREELDAYRLAVPGAAITLIRLRATVGTLLERIARRGTDSDPTWACDRTRQLAEEMDLARLEDLLVDTDRRSVGEVADAILVHVGWLAGSPSSPPSKAGEETVG